jgi:hypothetical protein
MITPFAKPQSVPPKLKKAMALYKVAGRGYLKRSAV